MRERSLVRERVSSGPQHFRATTTRRYPLAGASYKLDLHEVATSLQRTGELVLALQGSRLPDSMPAAPGGTSPSISPGEAMSPRVPRQAYNQKARCYDRALVNPQSIMLSHDGPGN